MDTMIDPTTFFTLRGTTTRGHQHKLFNFSSWLVVRHNLFTNRVVNYWNSLLSDVVSATSVEVLKKRLDDFWAQSIVCSR